MSDETKRSGHFDTRAVKCLCAFSLGLAMVLSAGTSTGSPLQNRSRIAAPPNGVEIPGLGRNPWAIENFVESKNPLSEMLKDLDPAKAEKLRQWAEEQKGKLTPAQREMLAKVMRDMEGKKWDGNAPWKDLVDRLYPQGSEDDRSKLQSILKGETPGLGQPPQDGPATGPQGELKAPQANPVGPMGGMPPTPAEDRLPMPPQRGAAGSPPVPEETQRPNPMGTSPTPNSPGAPTPGSPFAPTGNDRIERTLKTLFPLGLDRWAKPLASDLLKNGVEWSKNWKLPKEWTDRVRSSLAGMKLPQVSPMVAGPNLPQVGGLTGSSRSLLPLLLLVLGLGAALAIGFFWYRLNPLASEGSRLGFRTRGPGKNLIEALELAILRVGGENQAVANHASWQAKCKSAFLQGGFTHQTVKELFDDYLEVKYRGVPLEPHKETQLVAALNRL